MDGIVPETLRAWMRNSNWEVVSDARSPCGGRGIDRCGCAGDCLVGAGDRERADGCVVPLVSCRHGRPAVALLAVVRAARTRDGAPFAHVGPEPAGRGFGCRGAVGALL